MTGWCNEEDWLNVEGVNFNKKDDLNFL